MTPLAQAIEAVESGRSEPQLFYDLFLLTELLVPVDAETMEATVSGELGPEDEVSILVVESKEGQLVPAFDSADKLKTWAGQEMPFMAVKGHVLVDLLDDDLQIALNPNTDQSKLIDSAELTTLRRWVEEGISEGDAPEGPIRVAPVTDVNPDLDDALFTALQRHKAIKQAFLLAAVEEGRPEEEAHLLVMLDLNSADDETFQRLARDVGIAIRPCFGENEFFEIMRFEVGDNVSEAVAEEGITPYFVR